MAGELLLQFRAIEPSFTFRFRQGAQVLEFGTNRILAIQRKVLELFPAFVQRGALIGAEFGEMRQPALDLLPPLGRKFRKFLLPLLDRHFLEALQFPHRTAAHGAFRRFACRAGTLALREQGSRG